MVALASNVVRQVRYGLPLAGIAAAAVTGLPAVAGPPPYRFSCSPAQEVQYALADARAQPIPANCRYLTLGHLTPEQANQAITAVNLALQSVSRVRAITPAVRISETVLRIDASAYVNDAAELEQWELAWASIAAQDFYHHLPTQVLGSNGKAQNVVVSGGWTGLANESALRGITGTPGLGAVLRADYFATQSLRPPAYYAFAGIGSTQTAFLKGFGIDEATIERLEANAGANLIESGVTHKARRIVWELGPLGSVFYTLDSKVGDAAHNPFYYPSSVRGFQGLQYDAGEFFFLRANGYWGTAIFDNKGNRLDAVDPEIATDTVAISDGSADGQVRSGYSCLLCHSTNGLNSFSDDQGRLLQTKRGRVGLSSYDPANVNRILGFYLNGRLQKRLEFDRQENADALRQIGTDAQQSTAALEAVVKWSRYDAVTPQIAATELQTTLERLPEVIGQTADPNLAALLEGLPITRDAWNSCYAEAAIKRWGR